MKFPEAQQRVLRGSIRQGVRTANGTERDYGALRANAAYRNKENIAAEGEFQFLKVVLNAGR